MLESVAKRSVVLQTPISRERERTTYQSSRPGASFVMWSPVASEVSFEYDPGLFRHIKIAPSDGDVRGVLYGLRNGRVVRVMMARTDNEINAAPAGLEKLGIFAIRTRGRIFLTQSDLDRFQQLESGVIALVVARAEATFFAREANAAAQRPAAQFVASRIPLARRRGGPFFSRSKRVGAWFALVAALTAIPVLARPVWHRSHPALTLTVRESGGQLRIAWTPEAVAGPATLEITDGSEHRIIPISPELDNLTYVRHSGEVQVRFQSGDRHETASYVGTAPETVESRRAALRQSLAELEAQAKALRSSINRRQQKVAQLEETLSVKEALTPGK